MAEDIQNTSNSFTNEEMKNLQTRRTATGGIGCQIIILCITSLIIFLVYRHDLKSALEDNAVLDSYFQYFYNLNYRQYIDGFNQIIISEKDGQCSVTIYYYKQTASDTSSMTIDDLACHAQDNGNFKITDKSKIIVWGFAPAKWLYKTFILPKLPARSHFLVTPKEIDYCPMNQPCQKLKNVSDFVMHKDQSSFSYFLE